MNNRMSGWKLKKNTEGKALHAESSTLLMTVDEGWPGPLFQDHLPLGLKRLSHDRLKVIHVVHNHAE